MKKIKIDKVTCTSPKKIGVPRTVKEKFDYMNKINPNLQKLKDTLGLEISL